MDPLLHLECYQYCLWMATSLVMKNVVNLTKNNNAVLATVKAFYNLDIIWNASVLK